MSKCCTFYIDRELSYLLSKPFRNRKDIILILLKTVEKLLTPNSLTLQQRITTEESRDVFKVFQPDTSGESQQRVFYYNLYEDDSYAEMYTIHSFHFPFTINVEDDPFLIRYKHSSIDKEINAYFLSRLTFIINLIDSGDYDWGDTWLDEMLEIYYSTNGEDNRDLFYMVNDLLSMDFGYIRYDNDPKHEKENHPRHHFDINLDKRVTFKIGLTESLNIDNFAKIIDNNSEVKSIR